MNFLPEKIDQYIHDFTSPETPILKELNRETYVKMLMPRMLSGHYQGRAISMLSHMIKPKRILEIGTYTGYSALCWAEGLTNDGVIYTIDINEELHDMIEKYIQKSAYATQIKAIIGNALEIIPTLHEEFDIVFIDADKENYSAYYDLVFDKVKKGGYIMADNVLWSGKVTDEKELKKDFETKALNDYSKKVMNDPRVENLLLGIRDGIMISRKR